MLDKGVKDQMINKLSIMIGMMKIAVFITLCGIGFLFKSCDFPDSKSNGKLDVELKYIGVAVQEKGKHVWGSSPVIDKNGKVHLYVAEWPIPQNPKEGFRGWTMHSQIAHYIGDSPEGPFKFVRIAVTDQDGEFNSPHNPTISYIDGKYVLCFIVNENNDLRKQRIIMYTADDLNDHWKPAKNAGSDGTILTVAKDTSVWSYGARLGVSNPSLIKHNGKYMLYYKSVVPDFSNPEDRKSWDFGYGLTISEKLEGPYKYYSKRVTDAGIELEDAFVFNYNEGIHIFSRDLKRSKWKPGGGLLWFSKDGYYFSGEDLQRGFEPLSAYIGEDALKNASVYRGSKDGSLERPQLLKINNKPAYLYVATGINSNPGCGSASHIFKIILKE